MQTFRRLNDPEKYYGLGWRGWLAAGAAGGVLYLAVRLSPLGTKPTISITVIVLALTGSVLFGLSGQALGPARFAATVLRYATTRKQFVAPERPDGHGFLLADLPLELEPISADIDSELGEVFS